MSNSRHKHLEKVASKEAFLGGWLARNSGKGFEDSFDQWFEGVVAEQKAAATKRMFPVHFAGNAKEDL